MWEYIDLDAKRIALEKCYTLDVHDISSFAFLLNDYLTSDSLDVNYESFFVINSGFVSESN